MHQLCACCGDYYLYVPFDTVVGFTPDWKELQAVNNHGGIYVVPLDLQLAPYKDKIRLQAAIKHYRDTHNEQNSENLLVQLFTTLTG